MGAKSWVHFRSLSRRFIVALIFDKSASIFVDVSTVLVIFSGFQTTLAGTPQKNSYSKRYDWMY
jgi:hypothetical protein